MADIDKALPNDKRPDEVAEEVDVEEIEELKNAVVVYMHFDIILIKNYLTHERWIYTTFRLVQMI